MNKYSKKIPSYTLFYWIYLGLSIVTMLIFLLALFYCFFSKFKENVTLLHLVLLVILLLLTNFFRVNALYYQTFIFQIETFVNPGRQVPPLTPRRINPTSRTNKEGRKKL